MGMVDSPVSPSCDVCFKQELMLFKCKYCGGSFCAEHRLPENHACVGGYNTGGTWFARARATSLRRRGQIAQEEGEEQ